MDITPMDIAHKEFSRGFRGFNADEVRDFLEEVSAALEKLLSERTQLLQEIELLKGNLERYHNIEDTLQNTLVLAQRTSEEYINNANRQSELIVADARRKGETIQEEFARVKAQKEQYMLDFRAMLETYLKRVEEMQKQDRGVFLDDPRPLGAAYEPADPQ
jgi:cell division initiation protein